MDNIKKRICSDILKDLFDYYIENFGEEKNDFFEYKDEAKFSAVKYLTEKGFIRHYANLRENKISYSITKEGIEFCKLKLSHGDNQK